MNGSAMNATNHEALMQTLKEFRRRLDYFGTLPDVEEELIVRLRSAAERIESAVERLASSRPGSPRD